MSTVMRMTLIGMFNYDNTLFDNVTLPEGYDKDTFIQSLLLEHGEKGVLYPDVDFMKFSLGVVSRKWEYELKRIYEALSAEYDPISNYDRHEDITDKRVMKKGTTIKADYSNNRKPNTTQSEEVITPEITETEVSAYNENGYSPSDRTKRTQGKTNISTTGSDDVTIKGTLSEQSGKDTDKFVHKAHVYGNIGVTTASAMVNEVVAQRRTKNIYALAARIFANEVLIQIY